MNFEKFKELTAVSFREALAYRLDSFMSLISSGLILVLYYFVWKAIAASGQLNTSLNNIITYLAVAQVVKNTAFVKTEDFFGHRIKRGTIVNELKRPVSIFSQAYFHELGKAFFNFLSRSIPIAVIGVFILNITLPSLSNGFLFLFSLFMGFNLVFLLSYATSMLIFWTKIEWAIRGMRSHLQGLLSGLVFPLFLVPDSIKPIFNLLPFQAMVDGPIRIFMMDVSGRSALLVLANQLVWTVILLGLAHYSWKKAKRKLTVQGG